MSIILPPGASGQMTSSSINNEKEARFTAMKRDMSIKSQESQHIAKEKRNLGNNVRDIGMGVIDLTAGAVTSVLTGKRVSDLAGYKYNSNAGDVANTVTGVERDISSTLAPIAAGAVGTIVGGPVGGAAASAGVAASQSAFSGVGEDVEKWSYEEGGQLIQQNTGGQHSENPLGGVDISKGAQIEEGETFQTNNNNQADYVYSNKLAITEEIASKFGIPPKYIGKTYAEVTKDFEKKINKFNSKDKIVTNTLNRQLENIKHAQELHKKILNESLQPNQEGKVQLEIGGKNNFNLDYDTSLFDTKTLNYGYNRLTGKFGFQPTTFTNLNLNMPKLTLNPDAARTAKNTQDFGKPINSEAAPVKKSGMSKETGNALMQGGIDTMRILPQTINAIQTKKLIKKNKPVKQDIRKFDIQQELALAPDRIIPDKMSSIERKKDVDQTSANLRRKAIDYSGGSRASKMDMDMSIDLEGLSKKGLIDEEIDNINNELSFKAATTNQGVAMQAGQLNAQLAQDVKARNQASRQALNEANRGDEAAYLSALMGINNAIATNTANVATDISREMRNPYQYDKYGKYKTKEAFKLGKEQGTIPDDMDFDTWKNEGK